MGAAGRAARHNGDAPAPYLRYYSSKQLLDDHGEWPMVLLVPSPFSYDTRAKVGIVRAQ